MVRSKAVKQSELAKEGIRRRFDCQLLKSSFHNSGSHCFSLAVLHNELEDVVDYARKFLNIEKERYQGVWYTCCSRCC